MTDYMMKKVFNLHNLTVIKVKASLIKKNNVSINDNNKKITIFTPKELFDLYKKC
jgi:hypothetical protein